MKFSLMWVFEEQEYLRLLLNTLRIQTLQLCIDSPFMNILGHQKQGISKPVSMYGYLCSCKAVVHFTVL